MTTQTARTFPALTDRQAAALVAFAREHGPAWKARLGDLWYRAAAQPTLHALRNSHGPEWLAAFAMEQPARLIAGCRVRIERGCALLGLRKGDRDVRCERIDGLTVTLVQEQFPLNRRIVLTLAKASDLGGLTTALRDPCGTVVVSAQGCEAPRE